MIIGLTDSKKLRRVGKIRAGKKEEKGGREFPVNTPDFLLHDAPQLIPILGEHPTEIYFTPYSSDLNLVAQNDLRYYTKTELMCIGDGGVAAYFPNGDASGVKASPGYVREMRDGNMVHRPMPRSRERTCLYKTCPDYQQGKCSEHLFLDMLVPQYSMGSIFTLENTSITGLLNVMGAFNGGLIASRGNIAGQIFRIFKYEDKIPFQNKDGKMGKRDAFLIGMEHVPLETYLRKFEGKISEDSLLALMDLRNGTASVAPAEQVALPAPGPASHMDDGAEEARLREMANAPHMIEQFEKLSSLMSVPNSEENRLKTAKAFPDQQRMFDYLKKRVKELSPEVAVEAKLPKPVAAAASAADAGGPVL
jgi:hypothetical protein